MRQRHSHYAPSSSHKLAEMVAKLPASLIGSHLNRERDRVAILAGPAGADWAILQLSTKPRVLRGWPNPCKAARMSMKRAVRG